MADKITLNVGSEVGRLRSVLMHEPGREVDLMVPVMMEELLFDDILYGDTARAEHSRFRRVLQLAGVEVIDAQDLLAEALAINEARSWLVESLFDVLAEPTRERLLAVEPAQLAKHLVHGILLDHRTTGIDVDDLFEVPPIPNWCFQRDPQVVIGENVMISAMATAARWRETLLASAIFRFHPRVQSPVLLDLTAPGAGRRVHLGPMRPRFEGGDVLVLSPAVVAVGLSERTNRTGVRRLIDALATLDGGPRWMVVVQVPPRRAYMHIDTVLTPIDHGACLVYPPIISDRGSDAAQVYEIDLHAANRRAQSRESLLGTLKELGIDYEPIPCGGDDPVLQQREQWTDGANAFAIAPGVIVLFDRNRATAETLDQHGYRVVSAEELLLGRAEVDVDSDERTCILLPSHEISRARGGPHCLTHPLVRDVG